MDRQDYTNGEIGIILDEFRGYLIEIKEHVSETNGRVKSLEMWKQFLFGAWAVLSIATPIVWYLVISYANNLIESYDQKIGFLIQKAIEENNDKYFEK